MILDILIGIFIGVLIGTFIGVSILLGIIFFKNLYIYCSQSKAIKEALRTSRKLEIIPKAKKIDSFVGALSGLSCQGKIELDEKIKKSFLQGWGNYNIVYIIKLKEDFNREEFLREIFRYTRVIRPA